MFSSSLSLQKNTLKKVFALGFLLTMFLGGIFIATATVSAQTNPDETAIPGPGTQETAIPGPGTDGNQAPAADLSKLKNPLEGTVDDIPGFVETLLNIVLLIGIPLVALAIIYSGFKYVAAQGSPDKLKDANKTFLATLIGAAIILGAFIIANAIGGTVRQLTAFSDIVIYYL